MSSNGGSNGAEQLFTIEEIVKRKVEYDDVTYRIKWKDWNDKTWEPRDTLADTAESAVLDFERDYFQKGVQKIEVDEQRVEEEKRKAAELVVKREREEKLKKMMTGSLIPSSFAFNRKRKLEDDELKSSSAPSASASSTSSQNGDTTKCTEPAADTATSKNSTTSTTSEDSSLPAQKRARTDSGASVDSSSASKSSAAAAASATACGALSSKLDKSMGASRTPNSGDTHVFKKRARPIENASGVTPTTDGDDPPAEEKSSSANESAKDVTITLKEETVGSPATSTVGEADSSPPQSNSPNIGIGEEDGVGLECPLPKSRKLERGQSPNAVKKEEALKTETLKDEDSDTKSKGSDPPSSISTPSALSSSSSEGTSAQSTAKTEEETQKQSTTGLFFDRKCLFHFGGSDEPECPERYEACVNLLVSKGIDKRCCLIQPGLASDDDLRRVHDEKLLDELNTINERLVEQANDSRVITDMSESYYENEYTLECVRRSVAASIDMTKRVYDGELENGFCLIRPPGHHCDRSKRFGFCHANNVAIAAKYLLKERRARRIAILDWDVHHGNGTQDIFHDEKEVLFISIHQEYADENDKMFPATGEVSDIGDRSARGYTMNLPIPCGCGDREYKAMFDDVIMPALEEFNPEILLISAGFDSADGDPLGSLELKPEMFAHMTRLLMDRLNGKVVLFLEGGYNPKVVAKCVAHCMYALLGDDLKYAPPRSEEYDFIFHHLDKFVLTHRKYWLRIDQNNLPSEALKRPSKKSKMKKRWQLYRRRHKHKKLMRQRERERERAERREKRLKKHQNHNSSSEKEKSERKSVDLSETDDETGACEKAEKSEKDQKARDGAKQKKRERHEQRRREKEERQKEREKRKHKKKKRKHASDDEAYAVNDDISQYHKKKKKMNASFNGVLKSNVSGDISANASGGSGGGNLVVKSGGPKKRGRPRKDSLNGASSAAANTHAASSTKNGTSAEKQKPSTVVTNGEKSSSASQNNKSDTSPPSRSGESSADHSSSNNASHVAAMTDDVAMARPHHVLLVE